MIKNENPGAATAWNVAFVALGYFALIEVVMFFADMPFSPGLPFVFIKAQHWSFPRWFSMAIGCIGAVVVGAQILNPFKVREVYGGAHFATGNEIKEMGLRAKTGLILGMTVVHLGFYGRSKRFYGFKFGRYLRVDQPLSVLVYAPPGTGKTTGIIIPSLLAEKGSCLVMDPKGEICDITRAVKAKTHKIIRFAPAEPGSAQWNPLSKTELPESYEETQAYVGRIAEALIIGADNGADQHWIESGRALFRFWAMFLIWRDGETSLGNIVKESVGGIEGGQAALNAALEDYAAKLPDEIKTEGYKFSRMEGPQFDGVIGTLNTKTKLFSDKTIVQNTTKSDFTFAELRKKPTALYLVVPINDMLRMKPLISLFFQIATDVFLAAVPKKEVKDKKGFVIQKADQRITMYLDEFVQMGKMPNVIKMPSVGRGYDCRAVYILQSFSQLQSVYGDKEASVLRNNCTYLVIFKQNEEKVAEDLSKSIGNRTRIKKSKNTQARLAVVHGGSESEEGVPLVRVQDIMSLPPGRTLVMVSGYYETPVDAHAAFYYKDRTMTKLLEGIASSKIPDEQGQLTPNPIPEPTLGWTQTSEGPAVQAVALATATAAAEAVEAANNQAQEAEPVALETSPPQEPSADPELKAPRPVQTFQNGGEIGDMPSIVYPASPAEPEAAPEVVQAESGNPQAVSRQGADEEPDEFDMTVALCGSGRENPAPSDEDSDAPGIPFDEEAGEDAPGAEAAPEAQPFDLDTIPDDSLHSTFDGMERGS